MISDLTGIVLAGGASSRFGSNKALARWGNATVVEAVISTMLERLPRVIVLAKKARPYAFLKSARVSVAEDSHLERHPVAGIRSGLTLISSSHAFICACDMPLLSPTLIGRMWEERGDYSAVIPVWNGQRQPLCGIYSSESAGLIAQASGGDAQRLCSLFDILRTRFFLEDEIRGVDPDGLSFLDVDTPQDYARARRLRPC